MSVFILKVDWQPIVSQAYIKDNLIIVERGKIENVSRKYEKKRSFWFSYIYKNIPSIVSVHKEFSFHFSKKICSFCWCHLLRTANSFKLIFELHYRSLKCARITIHINLFASFAANNSLWLLWYRVVLGQTDVISRNEV